MARAIHKLTDITARAAKPGRHADGGGLYLEVAVSGSRAWLLMWKREGRRTAMGLGGYPSVSLARARNLAAEARKAVVEGRNPLVDARKAQEPTFAACVAMFLTDNSPAWRNAEHRWQWESTLGNAYCRHLQAMKVSAITTEDVLRVLQPVWQTRAETASRLRGRIERVLSFAKVKDWRSGENPAGWRGHLGTLCCRGGTVCRAAIMRRCPMPRCRGCVERLRGVVGMAGAGYAGVPDMTAARKGEVLGATWNEVNLDAACGPSRPGAHESRKRASRAAAAARDRDTGRATGGQSSNDFVFRAVQSVISR